MNHGINANWAGNYQYRAKNLLLPRSVAEIQQIVTRAKQVKALGTRHCFNDIADCDETQISLARFNRVLAVDQDARQVTFESGLSYGQLCPTLDAQGLALHNLASLPHISVVGACATATHGSGVNNGNLATAVAALEFVSGAGELVTLRRGADGDKFNGAVVNLGSVGVVTKLTLDAQPSFSMRQDLFENLEFQQLSENFDAIMACGYSVSLFTNWENGTIRQVWVKRRADDAKDLPRDFYGATAATENLHPLAGKPVENCTAQLGVAGAWFERLPHFRMGLTPSGGAELQSEYFVARENALEAFFALDKISDVIRPQLLVTEIRAIAADDLWLSPCYQRDSLAFHFTWKPNEKAVGAILPQIETALAPFAARPHWGKLFTMPAATLHARYERMRDFQLLLNEFDPQGKFRNDYLKRHITGV